ncbi:hypothetical protein [Deinococcus sp. UYEF24]
MTPELAAAVRQLYVAFADEPRPSQVIGCTFCCCTEQELNRLVEVPREALTADELDAYSSSVLDTIGTEADFKYFLPRIFELVAEGELQREGASWKIRRLKNTAWTTWPVNQVQAVRDYLMAWWLEALSADKGASEEHLPHIAEIEPIPEFRHYLSAWLTAGRPALVELAVLIWWITSQDAFAHFWNPFAPPEADEALYQWLCSGPPARALEQAHDDDPTAPEALMLIEAAALVTP